MPLLSDIIDAETKKKLAELKLKLKEKERKKEADNATKMGG